MPRGALAAAPPDPLTEDSFFSDLPVVLSVSRLAQALADAPGAVTVIDSETIRLSGAREVAELFRLVPGFQVGRSAASPRLYYHGALEQTGQRMQVLIDGRSVYSPFFAGGVSWNNVPLALEDIERIEAVRGSNSAAYGANAFLGVVNIITKHPAQTPQGWAASQSAGGGINDTLLRYSGSLDNGDYRMTVGHRSDPGFDNTKSDRDVRHFNFRSDWRSGGTDEFQLQIGGTDSSGGTGRPDLTGDQARESGWNSAFLLARWQRTPAPDEELRVTYYHTDERSRDNFPYPDPGIVLPVIGALPIAMTVDYGGTSTRDSIEVQHTFSPGKDLRLVWGGELRHDAVRSHALYATTDTLGMDLARVFANLEWHVTPSLLLNAGASMEKSSLSATESAPRLALNYHLTPENTFRIGISKASRAPSIFEERADLAFYLQGVPIRESIRARGNLLPEHIISREIGYLGDFRSIGLTIDLRLFHERLSDLATKKDYSNPLGPLPPILASLPPIFQQPLLAQFGAGPFNMPNDYINSKEVDTIRGLEYQLNYRPWPGTRLMLNQSFMRIASPSPAGLDQTGDRQAAPTHSTSVALFQKLPGEIDLSVMLDSVGAMYWPGSGVPQVVPAYTTVDLRLSHGFKLGGSRAEVAIMGRNLGGNHAETDVYYTVARQVFGSLSVNF